MRSAVGRAQRLGDCACCCEHALQKGTQSRQTSCNNACAALDRGPDCDVRGVPEEIVDLSEAVNVLEADHGADACARGEAEDEADRKL